jgi:hypothetical protein
MSKKTQPEDQNQTKPPLRSELAELASKFVALLETEFIQSTPDSASGQPMDVFRQHITTSFVDVLCETGARPHEVAKLLQTNLKALLVPGDEPWTDEKNDRRINLIDKSIQQSLSPEESFELDQLTEQLRNYCDTEEAIPTKGAKKLHDYLLDLGDSSRDSD